MKKFNVKNGAHFAEVSSTMLRMIAMGNGEWRSIVEEIRKNFDVKNWLHVRSVLQLLRDSGTVKRTEDLHKEVYVLGKEDPHLCNR